MGDVTTSGSSNTPTNKNVQPTLDMLLKGLQSEYKGGVDVFNKSLYSPVGQGTQNAWAQGTKNANGLISGGGFNSAQQGAMSGTQALGGQYGALGQAYDPNSPAYQQLRSKVQNDTATGIYSDFNNSGLFGSDVNMKSAGQGIGDALAGLDYGNMQNNINNQYRSLDSQKGIYDTLFGQGQQGILNKNDAIGQLAGIGAGQDANRQAQLLGENDLFRRQNDSGWEALTRGSSILSGTAGVGGSTSSSSVPWWAALLGGAATGASIFG